MSSTGRALAQGNARNMLGRRSTGWWAALSLPFLLAASPAAVPPAPGPGALTLRYDVYARGLPVLSLDFYLDERPAAYEVAGLVSTQCVPSLGADFTLRTDTRVAIAADTLRPS